MTRIPVALISLIAVAAMGACSGSNFSGTSATAAKKDHGQGKDSGSEPGGPDDKVVDCRDKSAKKCQEAVESTLKDLPVGNEKVTVVGCVDDAAKTCGAIDKLGSTPEQVVLTSDPGVLGGGDGTGSIAIDAKTDSATSKPAGSGSAPLLDGGSGADAPKVDAGNGGGTGTATGTGTGTGSQGAVDTASGSTAAAPLEGADIEDGQLVLKGKVARVEVETLIDHDSTFIIENDKIYWRHVNLGVPANTTVRFYDAAGKLINTNAWVPLFEDGKGANCHLTQRAVLYCEHGCDCLSDEVKLEGGHDLKGVVSKFKGRGHKEISTGLPIKIHIMDYPNLSGQGHYGYTIE